MFKDIIDEWTRKERGSLPTPIECTIIIWVFAIMWKEIKVRRIPIDFVILFSFPSVARKTISFKLIKNSSFGQYLVKLLKILFVSLLATLVCNCNPHKKNLCKVHLNSENTDNFRQSLGSVRNRASWICPRFVELGRHLHQYLFRWLDCASNHCLYYRETWGGFGYQSLYQKRALERLRPLPDFGRSIWSRDDFQLLETSPYFLNQPTLRTSTSEYFEK